MARRDPTYTGADIIRFWCKNLDFKERNEVLLFFWVIVPGLLIDSRQILAALALIADLIRDFRIRLITRLLVRLFEILQAIDPDTWARIIFRNKKTRKVVIKCIRQRQRSLLK